MKQHALIVVYHSLLKISVINVRVLLCVPGDMVMTHTLPGGDDWNGVPATSRSNFSNWLNKESFQLQQTGTRYRVNDFIDRRLMDRQCHGTSSSPGTHLRDVTKTRIHCDAGDASRNVRFDDVNTTAITQDHALSCTPADVTCTSNHTAGAGVINHR